VFDKDKIFASEFDDNELFIYQRVRLLARDVPPPDLVVYLQTPTDVLLRRPQPPDGCGSGRVPAGRRLPAELNEAYHHFLLSLQRHAVAGGRNLAVRLGCQRRGAGRSDQQIRAMGSGTRYYVPRTK
jgi:hypothetical protein